MKENLDLRFGKFALVGFSGVLVNLAVFSAALHLRLPVIASSVAAALVAMFSNFLLNDRFTWPEGHHYRFLTRIIRFYLICSFGILMNSAVLAMLHLWLHWDKYLAQVAGIFTAVAWNFLANHRWTWGGPAGA